MSDGQPLRKFPQAIHIPLHRRDGEGRICDRFRRESAIRGNNSNLNEAFGEVKLFHPENQVRVYEAGLSMHAIGNYSRYDFKKKVDAATG